MLLAKFFAVPVEPVVKPAEATTSQKPFFDPGASTSSLANETSGRSLVPATGEAVDEMEMAIQPLEAPSAGTATQPVQAPSSVPDVQPACEGDLSAASDSEGDQQSVTSPLSDEHYRYGSPDRDLPREEATEWNFQRRPATERQCEVSEALWVATRFQSLKLCPLLMTTLLPVHMSNPPVKCL